ncbi:large ribosomal subunit protein bL27m [Prorops nasuta]|uniref:large ribosomal subunit protein bL27m n=1 Tax=Prorops nasuta TaxID=863751 RepID=UPI0034CEFCC6
MQSLLESFIKRSLFLNSPINQTTLFEQSIRHASKKASGSTRNKPIKTKPKHRRLKVQDGHVVTKSTMLATQLTPRYHPGLHVGFGRNATLYALESGRVMITCEQIDPRWDFYWVKRAYEGREGQVIYKKYVNVIPEPQHNQFKLIDLV